MVLHSLSCLGYFFLSFLGAIQNPRLGVSSSSAPAFRFWVLFCLFVGDAKSLAWVFLTRRVLPFMFALFFCFLGGDAKSLAWVLLAL